jgi:hypothetical protein
VVKIQATIKGFVTRARVNRSKLTRKDRAILKIQSFFRGFLVRQVFKRQKAAIMKMQANVLTRQTRRAFVLLKGNAELAQAFIKRFLAMQWFKRMRESKESLEYHVGSINNLIKNYEHSSN